MEVVEVKDEAFMIKCSRLCGTLLGVMIKNLNDF